MNLDKRTKFLSLKCSDSSGLFVLAEFQLNGVIFRVVRPYAPNRNPAPDDIFNLFQMLLTHGT